MEVQDYQNLSLMQAHYHFQAQCRTPKEVHIPYVYTLTIIPHAKYVKYVLSRDLDKHNNQEDQVQI